MNIENYHYSLIKDFNIYYKYKKKQNIAFQLTFPSIRNDEIQIQFGITRKGYGWTSSYQGITNVGLTDIYNSKIDYKK